MFIMAKRNLVLPSADSLQNYRVQRDFVGEIPDWATETRYFDRLVKDGKILIVPSRSDKDTQAAAEKAVKVRRGKADTEKPAEAEA